MGWCCCCCPCCNIIWSIIRSCSLSSLLLLSSASFSLFHLSSSYSRNLSSASACMSLNCQWTDALPLTLLGIHTAFKSDLQCSSAELVFGTTLHIPGEFFQQSLPVDDPTSLLGHLKSAMHQLSAPPVRPQTQRKVHIDSNLFSCTHVFVRNDSVRKPLQPPYDGPYRVLSHEDKYFKLELNGRQDTVSIDCLKPAHLDVTTNESIPPPPTPPTEIEVVSNILSLSQHGHSWDNVG